jgi:hypothetical protein
MWVMEMGSESGFLCFADTADVAVMIHHIIHRFRGHEQTDRHLIWADLSFYIA